MPLFREVSLERACTMIEELKDASTHEGITRVVSGHHPEFGWIHITFPPMGNSLMLPAPSHLRPVALPLVTQDFEKQSQ